MRYRSTLYLCILILSGLYALKALFHPGFFTSLDGWHNIARLYHYGQAVGDGQIPPRWISQLASGYGYPLFLFSFHAPWIIALPFLFMGISVITSVKIVLLVGFVLSGVVMYLWLREVLGEEAGFIAGFIYMWTPYRFSKILVGASVGEATVFLFLPLLFWGLSRVGKGKSRSGVLLGSLGFSGLILSHFMVLPLASVFIALFIFSLIFQAKEKVILLKRFSYLFLLGLILSAFYLLPLIAYSNDIKAKTMQAGFSTLYENHFVTLNQLIYSKWGYGPIIHSAKDGEISFQIGIAQWLGVILSLVILVKNRIKKSKTSFLIFPSLLAFILSIVFMIDVSRFLWNLVHSYIFVDYPWRFLSLTTFTGAILVGVIVSHFSRFRFLLAVFFMVISLYTNKNHVRVNQYTDIPLQLYIDSEVTTNTFSEYLPKWTNIDVGKRPESFIEPSEQVTSIVKRVKTNSIDAMVTVQKKTMASVNHLFFPGINLFIDGRQTSYTYDSNGKLNLFLPQGEHGVEVKFTPTKFMRFADGLSLTAIVVWVFLFAGEIRQWIFRKKLFLKAKRT
ncbi:hypothetical protein HYW55_03405 [Candidatus Gottesmanbacteria bacterium]|nr:hypothetical protein [Candidatus Gottesmanbacteria bacterium]